MNVFEFGNYRDIIKQAIQDNSHLRGYQSRLADAAGCQSSHLSQVLKGLVQLTPDQAAAICGYWQLGDMETDYFIALVSYERAGTSRLRARLAHEIERLRHEGRKLSSLVNPEKREAGSIKPEDAAYYWSNWDCVAINEILRLPEFRTVQAIAKRFQIPASSAVKTLEKLQDMGLVRQEGQQWLPNHSLIFEDKNEVLIRLFHRAMRERANHQLANPAKIGTVFTCVDTIARADIPLVTNALREAAKKQMALSDAGKGEELICLCIDFFVV